MSTRRHLYRDGTWEERRLEISVLTDGDPFDPKYATVYGDADRLTKERALELAIELFGPHHTSVTEVITTRKTEVSRTCD
jgi:hypothetical protein